MANTPLYTYVLVGNEPVRIEIAKASLVSTMYNKVKENSSHPSDFNRITAGQCSYYKLRTFVPFSDPIDEATLDCCNDKTTWEELAKHDRLQKSFIEDPPDDCIHVILLLPTDATAEIVAKLKQDHPNLFELLQLTVKKLGKWAKEDIAWNDAEWVQIQHNTSLSTEQPASVTNSSIQFTDEIPDVIRETEERLAKKRSHTNEQAADRKFEEAKFYLGESFSGIFEAEYSDGPSVSNCKEFRIFSDVTYTFFEDVTRVAADKSSALKASTFSRQFIMPPAFSHETTASLQYKQELKWEFSLYMKDRQMRDVSCSYRPNSDLSMISKRHRCPYMIAEVISKTDISDRYRMLLQAIAAARVGRYLMKSGARPFVLMGIYLTKDLVAERYLVCQAGEYKKVTIVQKNFNLLRKDHALEFLRQMYNFGPEMSVLEDNLDADKKKALESIQDAGRRMKSLTAAQQPQRTPSSSTAASLSQIESITEEATDAIFENDEVLAIMEESGCDITGVSYDHPHIAIIRYRRTDRSAYLKFTKDQREVEILQHLISVKSSTNHTVYPVRFWTIDKGIVFSMPNAGGWVTTVENLESNLFSIAKQLIEGVAFMHEQGVAHLDLKPENIIMNSSTGQLSIIDYSVSRRVRSPDEMITGFAGTPGYVAPEVGHKPYSPIRADLWSCGNVLYNLSNRCQPSLRRDVLVRVCIRLMSNNPLERPSMSEVVGWMSDQQVRQTDDAASKKNHHFSQGRVNGARALVW